MACPSHHTFIFSFSSLRCLPPHRSTTDSFMRGCWIDAVAWARSTILQWCLHMLCPFNKTHWVTDVILYFILFLVGQTWQKVYVSVLKAIVHPKMKICWKFTHSQATQDVEFVYSSEQIWRNFALHHLLTNESSAVNGCRQSPNSWKKHHNDPKVIHKTPIHQLMSCEVKSCMVVRNFESSLLAIIPNNAASSVSGAWSVLYFSPDSVKTAFHRRKQYY